MTPSIIKVCRLGTPWEMIDPFLVCAHHVDHYPPGNANLGSSVPPPNPAATEQNWSMYFGDTVPGFPAHPHRGFETITIVRQGIVDHSDSLGASARFGAGDVQWLTAGRGIVHAEMFPLLNPRQAEHHGTVSGMAQLARPRQDGRSELHDVLGSRHSQACRARRERQHGDHPHCRSFEWCRIGSSSNSTSKVHGNRPGCRSGHMDAEDDARRTVAATTRVR